MVHALKSGGAAAAAAAMAAQIASNAPPGLLARGVLVPVPLHPRRLRRRGFNQAERLAAALCARTGLHARDCLRRIGASRTQVGRDRAERLRGARGTVRLLEDGDVPPRAILVDDVVTTGATLLPGAAILPEHAPR